MSKTPAIYMTYKEFIETFVKTEKTFMVYQQGRYLVRVVKIPLTESVQALYANFTYHPEGKSEPQGFEFGEKMEVVGFIDCENNLRFPTYEFTHNMVDATYEITEEKRGTVIAAAIQKAVDKLAFAQPLPACKKDDAAYYNACEMLFMADRAKPLPKHSDFGYYVTDGTLIDYLAKKPGWAEEIARKWAADFGGHRSNGDVTNLEAYREDLAFIEKVKETMESIKADKSNKLHRYIEMKNAVKSKDAKTVTVEFKTADGEIASTKINADAFCQSNYNHWGCISLYEISPYHESDRVANLLPKKKTADGREYTANNLSKDDIIAIKYGRKTIWNAEKPDGHKLQSVCNQTVGTQ